MRTTALQTLSLVARLIPLLSQTVSLSCPNALLAFEILLLISALMFVEGAAKVRVVLNCLETLSYNCDAWVLVRVARDRLEHHFSLLGTDGKSCHKL